MTRIGYVWIFVSVGLAVFAVTHESVARDNAIRDATRGALYTGVRAGCDRDNALRNEVLSTARRLHPDDANEIQQSLRPEACQKLAEDLVRDYLQQQR